MSLTPQTQWNCISHLRHLSHSVYIITTYPALSSETWECPWLFLLPHSQPMNKFGRIRLHKYFSSRSISFHPHNYHPGPSLIISPPNYSNCVRLWHMESFVHVKSYVELQYIKHTKVKLLRLKRGVEATWAPPTLPPFHTLAPIHLWLRKWHVSKEVKRRDQPRRCLGEEHSRRK